MEVQAKTVRRQLVLLCDGTNSNLTGRAKDTNVVKLSELMAADPDAQRTVFYDPGVGNSGALPGATGWDKFRREVDRINGLAFGRGVYENMAETYLFLMRHYQPGDEIYIFGFSRGAFTARSVAGMVNLFGILRPHMESMVPTLLHIYFSNRHAAAEKAPAGTPADPVEATAKQLSSHFADPGTREVDIQFVGVWDTVASVGIAPFNTKITALPRPENKSFVHIRQALALDEHRSQFKPRLYAGENVGFKSKSGRDGTLDQRWFSGSHCDVGGGFDVDNSALSDLAFAWLVSQAVQCGLRLTDGHRMLDTEAAVRARLHAVHADVRPDRRPQVHSELCATAAWAVTGMTVRDTNRVVMDGSNGSSLPVHAEEHPANQALQLKVRENSVWATARTPWLVWVFLLALPLGLLALGQLLDSSILNTGSVGGDLAVAWQSTPSYWQANLDFQQWQLTGWINPAWPMSVIERPWALASWFALDPASIEYAKGGSPRWALFWDLFVIAGYTLVLSWFAARSFARIAGFQRARDVPPKWLNVLGIALPVTVAADVAENLLSWLSLTVGQNVVGLAVVLHIFAAACSLLKLVGLAGTLTLIAAGLLRSDRRKPVPEPVSV